MFDRVDDRVECLTGSPGSNIANAARFVADGISPALGHPVILDHRGGGAAVHSEILAKAPPDGYTLLLTGGSFWIGPLLQAKPAYDPIQDFSPVALVARAPGLIVVHPSLPVGGIGHLAAELFNTMAGVKIVRVKYTNDAVQTSELLSGLVETTFAGTNVMQHVKAGKLRALGVTGDQPSPLFPGVLPVAATIPGYSVFATNALVAPGGTPAVVIRRLNVAVVRFLELPATKELYLGRGLEAIGSTPEQLTALIRSERDTAGKVIKNMGIRAY
jgi:tripartite-type tricarboxylate transporter receptor subunit TctC